MQLDLNALITGKILLDNGGGGGGAGITKIAEKEFTVSTTSTSATDVGYVPVDEAYWTGDKIFIVTIIDKAGKRNGYFYGSASVAINVNAENGSDTALTTFGLEICSVNDGGEYVCATSTAGVYVANWSKGFGALVKSKYNSSRGKIDGTFKVTVYALDIPFLA